MRKTRSSVINIPDRSFTVFSFESGFPVAEER